MSLLSTPGGNRGTGHFYLAKNRTFLLCLDTTREPGGRATFINEKGESGIPAMPEDALRNTASHGGRDKCALRGGCAGSREFCRALWRLIRSRSRPHRRSRNKFSNPRNLRLAQASAGCCGPRKRDRVANRRLRRVRVNARCLPQSAQ
jgi:hypothetical protein